MLKMIHNSFVVCWLVVSLEAWSLTLDFGGADDNFQDAVQSITGQVILTGKANGSLVVISLDPQGVPSPDFGNNGVVRLEGPGEGHRIEMSLSGQLWVMGQLGGTNQLIEFSPTGSEISRSSLPDNVLFFLDNAFTPYLAGIRDNRPFVEPLQQAINNSFNHFGMSDSSLVLDKIVHLPSDSRFYFLAHSKTTVQDLGEVPYYELYMEQASEIQNQGFTFNRLTDFVVTEGHLCYVGQAIAGCLPSDFSGGLLPSAPISLDLQTLQPTARGLLGAGYGTHENVSLVNLEGLKASGLVTFLTGWEYSVSPDTEMHGGLLEYFDGGVLLYGARSGDVWLLRINRDQRIDTAYGTDREGGGCFALFGLNFGSCNEQEQNQMQSQGMSFCEGTCSNVTFCNNDFEQMGRFDQDATASNTGGTIGIGIGIGAGLILVAETAVVVLIFSLVNKRARGFIWGHFSGFCVGCGSKGTSP